jgi:ferredoxin
VNILVAVVTPFPDIPEMPCCVKGYCLFFMTGKTRCGKVGAFKLECPGIVLLNGEVKFVKAIYRVALRAIGRYSLPCELTLMVIFVATGATVKCHGICELCFVACSTGNFLMFAFQFKIGFTVVEILRPLYNIERYFRMALGAVLAELAVVRVFMAARTVVGNHSFKFLEFQSVLYPGLVAKVTRNLLMLAAQLKFGLRVIKFCSWFEGIYIVAIVTGNSKRLLVIIGMACQTGRV